MNDEREDLLEKINPKIWKKIFRIMKDDPAALIKSIVYIVLVGIIDIVNPLLNRYASTTFFVQHPDFSKLPLFILLYIILIIFMFIGVSGFIKNACKIEELITYTIRKEGFKKLQELSFSYYDVNSSGWILSRLSSDTKKLSSIISWGIVDGFWAIVVMIGTTIISMIINIKLSLILLAMIPLFVLIAMYYRIIVLKKFRKVRAINSQVTAAFSESFSGANTTKTLVLEDDNLNDFNKLINRLFKRSMSATIVSSLFWPMLGIVGYLGVGVIVIIASKSIFKINDYDLILIEAANLYLFINYAINFFSPIINLARIMTEFQQAQAAAERVVSLLETEVDIKNHADAISFDEKIKGNIEFKNVDFRYNKTTNNVLENFNLNIKEGESVAFVGETGSGKTTIVNLIGRFYEPTNGKILIDGIDYQKIKLEKLHQELGYVLQTPQLFSGTIFENIKYGKLDATLDEVIKACKIVGADRFIEKLPNKYDTDLGDNGSKLSVGEKQLISFARAIISNPSILILDEATSSIDTESEQYIINAMNIVMKGRTCLMVAHRLSTVVNVDKIIVLENGKIIEMGNHLELLKKKGYYYSLYKNQFIDDIVKTKIAEI